MNEVKKCSISGVAFTMDADAYQALENYLESLKKAYRDSADGTEIIADIEARIAELVLSAQDNTRVVEKPLVLNIIRQLGTAEDIADANADADLQHETPRIPRRLYRATEGAKLGGVCSGIGKYFDVDPVWIRLAMFLPLLLTCVGGLPIFGGWMPQLFSNLFGIFLICYFIMWFAVPAARTARQKLEMEGEAITVQSVASATAGKAATAPGEADSKAKPIIAETVSLFGKVVLILMKLFAGAIVLALILTACALIIGLFTLLVGGPEILSGKFEDMTLWVPILGIVIVMILVFLLIYVLMCLIASRKPNGRIVLVIFLLWLAACIACACKAIYENLPGKIREKRSELRQVLDTKVRVDGEMTTLKNLLEELDNTVVENEGQVHISVPSKAIDITIDKRQSEVKIAADGKEVSLRAEMTETKADDAGARAGTNSGSDGSDAGTKAGGSGADSGGASGSGGSGGSDGSGAGTKADGPGNAGPDAE